MKINKANAKHKLDWDYNGHGRTFDEPLIILTELDGEKFEYDAEKQNRIDWNQTLMTKLNHISASIHQVSFRRGGTHIVVSENIKSIIESFAYYNEEESKLGGRFNVSFTDETKDEILMYSKNEEELVAIPFVIDGEDSNMRQITFKHIIECTDEEIQDYKSGLIGNVTILNYED